MSLRDDAIALGQRAREAARRLAQVSSEQKNQTLALTAKKLESQKEAILRENEKDLDLARREGLPNPLLDRIQLNPERIEAMAGGLRDIAVLPDPVREVLKMWRRPNGLQVGRMRIPLGVIAIIYEARPNVTADAAGLCIKAGNAVILRGGSEAFFSNQAIGRILREACAETDTPREAIQVVESRDRGMVHELLQLEDYRRSGSA
jgi:glutamate-5-semialdehyde dehydrogenase